MAPDGEKTSVARVRLLPGNGKFIINGKDIEGDTLAAVLVTIAKQALVLTNTEGKYGCFSNVHGGGLAGKDWIRRWNC